MTGTSNGKGRGDQTTASRHFTSKTKFTGNSTATEAQYARIVKMLESGTKTTFDFRRAGIMAPSARIKELNEKRGVYIPTVRLVTITDEWGFAHRNVAVYELIDFPRHG